VRRRVPTINLFGYHGSVAALGFLILLVLWAVFARKSLLLVLCAGAVLFFLWHRFSGSASTQSTTCPASTGTSSALRGPYASIDQLMRCDGVGPYALQLTGSGTAEYGFVILHDRRQPSGGYYATPPTRSSQPANPGCLQRPTVQPQDFTASWMSWVNAAHVDSNDYPVAATVHTHPQCPMPSNSFTAADFDQAIALKHVPPTSSPPVQVEEIVMINANDRKVRTFSPRDADERFTAFGLETSDRFLPYVDPAWDEDALRVQIIATYP
jgi:hypothetical protein